MNHNITPALRVTAAPSTVFQHELLGALRADEEHYGVPSERMDEVLEECEELWAWRGRLAVARALGIR